MSHQSAVKVTETCVDTRGQDVILFVIEGEKEVLYTSAEENFDNHELFCLLNNQDYLSSFGQKYFHDSAMTGGDLWTKDFHSYHVMTSEKYER